MGACRQRPFDALRHSNNHRRTRGVVRVDRLAAISLENVVEYPTAPPTYAYANVATDERGFAAHVAHLVVKHAFTHRTG